MFITVKYGDYQQALFNPNCLTKNLLDDIKRRCKCEKDALVDLSDEHGNIKNLLQNTNRPAVDVLKPRGTFILIRVEKKENTEIPTYTPLCTDIEVVTTAFVERLTRPDSQLSQRNVESRQRRKSSSSSWQRARTSLMSVSGNTKARKPSKQDKRSVQISRENTKLVTL
ncbi:uncharacterized protein CXorf65 homolog [Exaiptasia diaphana]|uniref:Uncharacterized protein n=1 Tax=Exaiptasia diaphana TaxID=2652724 RepID=A0A913X5K9_EXADI|nr:uncharacterized protein CXorf65 homolog [Exaiptasia diaphana]KXJ15037.1 Uncharacterized protein CXorf65-like [Exaiptasia diaphana]